MSAPSCALHLPSSLFLPTMLRLCAAALTVAVATVVLAGADAVHASHSSSTIGLLALDPNVQGNTATSIGPIEGCARVEAGARIDVDYVVDSVPEDRPMIAFEVAVRYDPQLLEPVALDHRLLLAAVGSYSPFTALTDDLPDSDGNLLISVLDTASKADPEANVERGPGVLARISFLAKAAGVSDIAVVLEQEPPPVYPLVQDSQNETIFADRLGSASLAVGQECPAPAAEPKITDLAQVNQDVQNANLQLGASPTPADAPASPTPGATAEDETPRATTDPACIVSALQEPTPSPVPSAAPSPPPSSPAPEGQTTASPTATPTETPSATSAPAEVACTPKPTVVQEEIIEVSGDSDTVLIAGALALLVLGTAAGGGGWYLLRRSPSPAPSDDPSADTTPD